MSAITKWHVNNLKLILPDKHVNTEARAVEAATEEILELRIKLLREQRQFYALLHMVLNCQLDCPNIEATTSREALQTKLLDMIKEKE